MNLQYQGVVVSAGRHTIHLQYRNPLLIAGGIVSLIAAAVLVMLIVRGRSAANASSAEE